MHTRPNIVFATRGARISIFALFALCFAPFAAPAGAQEPRVAGPRLRIQEREIDFGTVRRGEKIQATFVLENVGSEPLKVVKVQPG